jgi:hypothetical protein
MIPLSDQGAEQPRGFPIVNVTIIVLNFLMFGVELIGGDPIVNGWSLIPKEIVTGQDIFVFRSREYLVPRRRSAW